MSKPKWDFRDISKGLKIFRDILLGRKHNLHGRFPPLMSPRSVPTPEIPRGPDNQYSKQYYYKRSAINSVFPPIVAPVAEGPPMNQDPTKKAQPGGIKPDTVCFHCAPTPGPPWSWDGHQYYECLPDPPPSSPSPCPQNCPDDK
uniref:NADH dehydrogenase [ubiquinone] 1 alpha subcomplex subunit 7 n=1 Tax=Bombyx mori TaxID=7091 RepID=A0A8R2AN89_BOMMO|nr:uncharacterized protein LOC101735561 isoform X1 [Bombyx mori]